MSEVACKFCGEMNPADYSYCKKCGIHVLTPKKPRTDLGEEKVRLGHGPMVPKSTADRIRKRNETINQGIMIFALILLALILTRGCS